MAGDGTARVAAVLGLPSGDLVWAVAAGILVGTVSVLSPMTIWFAIAMAVVFACAGRDLGPRERRWVMGILGVAVAMRVAMVAGLFLRADHAASFFVSFPFDGDGQGMKLRSDVIRSVWVGIPVRPHFLFAAFDTSYGWTSYLFVLGYLQFLMGPAPYGVHLFNIACAVAGAVVLYRTMRRAYGTAIGVGGLALMLFLPSLFFWSVTVMKESLQFLLVSIGFAATVNVFRGRTTWLKFGALIIAVLAVAAAGTVRRDVPLVLGVVGPAVGLLAFLFTRRRWLMVTAVLLLPVAGAAALRRPVVQDRVMRTLRATGAASIGNVTTEGHGYKLLDQRFYSGDRIDSRIDSMTAPEASRYVLRAFTSFVVTPTPWQMSSWPELAFLPQQMVWYLMIVFAVAGLRPGLQRDAIVTCLLGGYIVVGAAMISLASGNVGTFVRHKDIVTPFMIWLSVLGLERVLTGMVAPVRPARSRERQRLQSEVEAACL